MSNFAITTLCTITEIILTATFSFVAFRRNEKKNSRDEGQNMGVIMSELGYIKSSTDDIKREQLEQAKIADELAEELQKMRTTAANELALIDKEYN